MSCSCILNAPLLPIWHWYVPKTMSLGHFAALFKLWCVHPKLIATDTASVLPSHPYSSCQGTRSLFLPTNSQQLHLYRSPMSKSRLNLKWRQCGHWIQSHSEIYVAHSTESNHQCPGHYRVIAGIEKESNWSWQASRRSQFRIMPLGCVQCCSFQIWFRKRTDASKFGTFSLSFICSSLYINNSFGGCFVPV